MAKETSKNDNDYLYSQTASSTQRILDKFFIHQCIIRRFSQENPKTFQRLVRLRSDFELVVAQDLSCSVRQVHAVYYIMNAMQNSKMLRVLEQEEPDECKSILFDLLEPIYGLIQTAVKDLLTEKCINDIVALMIDSRKLVLELFEQTNVFRYYTLYASTIIINFDHLLKLQKLVDADSVPTYKCMADYSPALNRWLSISFNPLMADPESIYEKLQLSSIYRDLYCLLRCGGITRKFNSANTCIIDDRICDVTIDGKKSDGHLYLSVPYTVLPIDIDEAIRLLRHSLTGLLIDEGIRRSDTEDADYWDSIFYNESDGAIAPNTRGRTNILLVKQKNSVMKLQSGILVWDRVKINGDTIESALGDLSVLINSPEATLKKAYDYVASLINPVSISGNDVLSKALSKRDNVVVK